MLVSSKVPLLNYKNRIKIVGKRWECPVHFKISSPFKGLVRDRYNGLVLLVGEEGLRFCIYDEYKRTNEKLMEIANRLYNLYQFVKRKYNKGMRVPVVYLLLSKYRKFISPYRIENPASMINSAYTMMDTNEIVVYRNQELEMRFIHELVHAANMDSKCFSHLYPSFRNYRETSDETVLNEVCTEYITLKLFFTLYNYGIRRQRDILRKRVELFRYISSIYSAEGRSLFLRYHIIPTMILLMETIGRRTINVREIMIDVDKLLNQPEILKDKIYYKFIPN